MRGPRNFGDWCVLIIVGILCLIGAANLVQNWQAGLITLVIVGAVPVLWWLMSHALAMLMGEEDDERR